MGHDFCGWYYKCQTNEHAAALIPAVHTGGGERSCSLQLICDGENWNIPLPGRQLRMSRSRPWATAVWGVWQPAFWIHWRRSACRETE